MLQAEANPTIQATNEAQVVRAIETAIESGVPLIDYGVVHATLGHRSPQTHTRLEQSGGVIEHDAEAHTVRVAGGCTIGDLHRTLASAGQFLALDAEDDQTISEVLAHHEHGPLRVGYGELRGMVLALTLVDGRGKTHHLTRQEPTTIEGRNLLYEVIGGLGELGVITEATLRTHPVPPGTLGVDLSLDDPQRIDDLLPRWLETDARPDWLMLTKEDHRFVCRLGYFGTSGQCMLKLRSLETLLHSGLGVRIIGTGSDTFERDRLRRGMRGAWRRVVPALVEVRVPASSTGFICHALAEHPRTDPDRQVEAYPVQGAVYVGGPLNPDAARRLDAQIDHITQPVGGCRAWHRMPIGTDDLMPCAPLPEDYDARCALKRALDPHGVLNPGRFLRQDAPSAARA